MEQITGYLGELYSEDYEFLVKYAAERNIGYQTFHQYQTAVKKYVTFNEGVSLVDLIHEAEQEEIDGVRWKDRKIRQRLIDFRSCLYRNHTYSSAKAYFINIKALYIHQEIELHPLPKISMKKEDKGSFRLTFDNLLTKDELKKALPLCSPTLKSYVLFCVSSGCSRREALSLKVKDYFKALNINSVKELQLKDVGEVLTFKVHRFKTNKEYYTFCSPEASNAIKEALMVRKTVKMDSPLFKINHNYLNIQLHEINKKLNLGTVGPYIRFRSHMFRKFHASQLYNDGLSMELVDELQGRGKDITHGSYFVENPLKLKKMYESSLKSVTIQ